MNKLPDTKFRILPPANENELTVTAADRQKAEALFHAVCSGDTPYTELLLNGKKCADCKRVSTRDKRDGSKNTIKTDITYALFDSALTLTVHASFYPDENAVTVYAELENTSHSASPVVSGFAVPADFPVLPGSDGNLYYALGSDTSADDFTLFEHDISSSPLSFFADGGRSSLLYLPFFNISGTAAIGIGWTGQWKADFYRENDCLRLRVYQENLNTYLEPGEKIRTPLLGIVPYAGTASKGFNMFRRVMMNSVIPSDFGAHTYYCVSGGSRPFKNSAVEVREIAEEFKKTGIESYVDGFWFDAEHWFFDSSAPWDCNVGTWRADPVKYPDGFSAVSDMLHENGYRALLWYEPERMAEGSYLYNIAKENGWLFETKGSDYPARFFFDLSNDEACDFLIHHISESLKENKVDGYRQDFNCIRRPTELWEQKDSDNRRGITENRYVTNLYRYLDGLLAAVPGLFIDNCASGGQRMDLEMMRRSVPLWRSDLNCFESPALADATQSHIAGLSMFVPVSNASNAWEKDGYERLSQLAAVTEIYSDYALKKPDECKKYLTVFDSVRKYLTEDYFLLAPADPTDKTWNAMQYGTADEGIVALFRPENAPESIFLQMSGLSDTARYDMNILCVSDGSVCLTGKGIAKTAAESHAADFHTSAESCTTAADSYTADGLALRTGFTAAMLPHTAAIVKYKKVQK